MDSIQAYFLGLGLGEGVSVALTALAGLVIALIIGHVMRFASQKAVFKIVKPAQEWREALKNSQVFRGVALSLAVLLSEQLVLPLLSDWSTLHNRIAIFLDGLLVFLLTLTIGYAISAAVVALEKSPSGQQRLPFKVLGQALQLVVWSYGSVVLLSVLTQKDVSSLLAGMTAVGAVLVYVFRDPILGWMAGVQIAGNDLARYGDWITVPRHEADGQVIDIALTTIKIRNWDKTISTIPSYALVSEGFSNWRGMLDSGGRRIKRSLAIDATSVCLCDQPMLERLCRSEAVRGLVGGEKYVPDKDTQPFEMAAAHSATNLGYYRRWLQAWIRQHPMIHPDMTAMVRELEPEGRGIYVEIYAFSSDQRWEQYEQLQADICDYALAVLPQFDLRVFQEPIGEDLRWEIQTKEIE